MSQAIVHIFFVVVFVVLKQCPGLTTGQSDGKDKLSDYWASSSATSGGALSSPSASCNPSCYVKSLNGLMRSGDVCSFNYYSSGACSISAREMDSSFTITNSNAGFSSSSSSSSSINSNTPELSLKTRPINTANSAIDFSITLRRSGVMAVVVSGVTTSQEGRCVTIQYRETRGWQVSTVGATCLTLPHGTYNATVLTSNTFANAFRSSTVTSTAKSVSTMDGVFSIATPKSASLYHNSNALFKTSIPISSTSKSSFKQEQTDGEALIVAHQKFEVPNLFPWERPRNRSRRVGLTAHDLIWSVTEAQQPPGCPCYECIVPRHDYDPYTALLQFSYWVNITTYPCCVNCTSLNLVLYKYTVEPDEILCKRLNFTRSVVSNLRLVTRSKNITKSPVDYPNTGSGCYAFHLRPTENPSPIYHGFFWLQPLVNITNMNEWNTTFYLEPYQTQDGGKLKVSWTSPSYPFNFSDYELQLWHHRNHSINCRGDSIYEGPIVVFPKNKRIKISTTSYIFKDLSSGWYCVRVTPLDDRCPPDGCQPRSSLAKKLTIDYEDVTAGTDDPGGSIITLGVLLSAIGVLVAGVALACLVLQCRPAHGSFRVSYTKVNLVRKLHDTQLVLLVWTQAGPNGMNLEPVIKAFKKILSSYSHCRVYDYLDLISLPHQHRQHLLATPTAWVDTLLAQRSFKIIIVGSEGARKKQVESMCGGRDHDVLSVDLDPLDELLFPYLLRRLQDRPDLAGDYSRVFHVRFSDISSSAADIEGVVSWTRYCLPQHLRQLTLSLHGVSEDGGIELEEPNLDILRDLHVALSSHPLYRKVSDQSTTCYQESCGSSQHTIIPIHPQSTSPLPTPEVSLLPTPPNSEESCESSETVLDSNNSIKPEINSIDKEEKKFT